MNGGKVRKYELRDFNRVNELLKEAFDQCKDKEIIGDEFIELVCEVDNNVCGYLLVTKILNPIKNMYFYHVDYVCVDSNYRGNGIGRLLMNYVEDLARKENIMYIELTSGRQRVAAHKLYKKCGYEKRDSDIFRKVIL